MVAPDDNVIPFPGTNAASLRWCALSLANATSLADSALDTVRTTTAGLMNSAQAGSELAGEARYCSVKFDDIARQAGLCRSFSHQLAEL